MLPGSMDERLKALEDCLFLESDDHYLTRADLVEMTEIPHGTWKRWSCEGFGPRAHGRQLSTRRYLVRDVREFIIGDEILRVFLFRKRRRLSILRIACMGREVFHAAQTIAKINNLIKRRNQDVCQHC